MCSGEIAFGELPAIDDVAIEDQQLRLDAFEVLYQFCCVTTISAQVNITDNNNFYVSSAHWKAFVKAPMAVCLLCYRNITQLSTITFAWINNRQKKAPTKFRGGRCFIMYYSLRRHY